jgi:2-C-methyl-D-erythritol 4-phosphate cytidylyltransferase
MKVGLIITAGGKGNRFGKPGGKQLVEVDGKPIVLIACEKFVGIKEIAEVIITIDQEAKAQLDGYLAAIDLQLTYKVVLGGATRKQSVYNAFKALSDDCDMVMIHDGARPNVTKDMIKRLLDKAATKKAVIPVIPVVDTIKLVENNLVKETLPREKLFGVQTPQVFSYEILARAYKELSDCEVTDEASLVEMLGQEVVVVEGDRQNIKVTYLEDLKSVI